MLYMLWDGFLSSAVAMAKADLWLLEGGSVIYGWGF